MASCRFVLLLSIALSVVCGQLITHQCNPGACAAVSCLRPPCDAPMELRNGGYCGCCPICVNVVGDGEACDHEVLTNSRQCQDGFYCDTVTITCQATQAGGIGR